MLVAVEAPVRGPGVGGRQPRGEVHRRGLGSESGGGGPGPRHHLRVPRPGAGAGALVRHQQLHHIQAGAARAEPERGEARVRDTEQRWA